jgi:hypothetical protein
MSDEHPILPLLQRLEVDLSLRLVQAIRGNEDDTRDLVLKRLETVEAGSSRSPVMSTAFSPMVNDLRSKR